MKNNSLKDDLKKILYSLRCETKENEECNNCKDCKNNLLCNKVDDVLCKI